MKTEIVQANQVLKRVTLQVGGVDRLLRSYLPAAFRIPCQGSFVHYYLLEECTIQVRKQRLVQIIDIRESHYFFLR
jgi:hypothetical protein